MPIRAELRHHYGRVWRTVTRPRILARAKNCCEQCGVPNHKLVTRAMGWWMIAPGLWWFTKTWEPDKFPVVWHAPGGIVHHGDNFPREICHTVGIVLTIAHLNHVSGDDRDDNLKALCQWCHLNYDLGHHHETRAARKDAARPLLNQTPNQTPTKEAN